MTDLEITRLCAEAAGEEVSEYNGYLFFHGPRYSSQQHNQHYDPLHDDAQAMALVKKFDAWIQPPMRDGEGTLMFGWKVDIMVNDDRVEVEAESPDLNRAICECVAQLQG